MASTKAESIWLAAATGDTLGQSSPSGNMWAGFRLVAGIDAASAVIRLTNGAGAKIITLKAAAAGVDESRVPIRVGDVLHVTLTGTAPELYAFEDVE